MRKDINSEIVGEKKDTKRIDLVCVGIGQVKDKVKYLAEQSGIGVSAYLRQLISKEYKKERKCFLNTE